MSKKIWITFGGICCIGLLANCITPGYIDLDNVDDEFDMIQEEILYEQERCPGDNCENQNDEPANHHEQPGEHEGQCGECNHEGQCGQHEHENQGEHVGQGQHPGHGHGRICKGVPEADKKVCIEAARDCRQKCVEQVPNATALKECHDNLKTCLTSATTWEEKKACKRTARECKKTAMANVSEEDQLQLRECMRDCRKALKECCLAANPDP